MNYTQLSQDERYYISTMRAKKVSIRQIARYLGRSPSTVSREYKRNLRPSGYYTAFVAHSYALASRRRSRRGSQFPPECWSLIWPLLMQKGSPEQIAEHISSNDLYTISFQTITERSRIELQ